MTNDFEGRFLYMCNRKRGVPRRATRVCDRDPTCMREKQTGKSIAYLREILCAIVSGCDESSTLRSLRREHVGLREGTVLELHRLPRVETRHLFVAIEGGEKGGRHVVDLAENGGRTAANETRVAVEEDQRERRDRLDLAKERRAFEETVRGTAAHQRAVDEEHPLPTPRKRDRSSVFSVPLSAARV